MKDPKDILLLLETLLFLNKCAGDLLAVQTSCNKEVDLWIKKSSKVLALIGILRYMKATNDEHLHSDIALSGNGFME